MARVLERAPKLILGFKSVGSSENLSAIYCRQRVNPANVRANKSRGNG